MSGELERLVVRHRLVAPMLSALLAGTNATVTLRDPDGTIVLHREGGEPAARSSDPSSVGAPARYPIQTDGRVLGTVEGGPLARTIAAVLSYAISRELDKRALAAEALDRYRELSLIYDLAASLGSTLEVAPVATAAAAEVSRVGPGGTGFVLLLDAATGRLVPPDSLAPGPFPEAMTGEGIVGRVAAGGEPELVNVPASDDRATPRERAASALIVAPMRAHGRTVGVLGVVGSASDPAVEYRASDLKIVTAIAALGAPALDHALVHEAVLRDAAERERALTEELEHLRSDAPAVAG